MNHEKEIPEKELLNQEEKEGQNKGVKGNIWHQLEYLVETKISRKNGEFKKTPGH